MIATSLAAAIALMASPASNTVITTYIAAFEQEDPTIGQELAEPNSPAYWYVTYQSLQRVVLRDSGAIVDPMTANVSGGAAEVCYAGDAADANDPCVQLSDFTVDSEGLIISFTADGAELAPRLGVAAEPVPVGTTATASVLVAYQRGDDSLAVIVSLQATGATSFNYDSTYVNPDGRQVVASDDTGPDVVLSGAHAVIMLTFPASVPGGRVGWQASTVQTGAVTFEMPVPALVPSAGTATTVG